MSPVTVRIFVTGGTFDKEYNELTGALFFKDTHLPRDASPGPLPRRRVDHDADDDRQPGHDRLPIAHGSSSNARRRPNRAS